MSDQTLPIAPATVVLPRRSWRGPLASWLFTLVAVLGFGATAASTTTRFALGDNVTVATGPQIAVPTVAGVWVLALVLIALSAWGTWLVWSARPLPRWYLGAFALVWVVCFMLWAMAGKSVSLPGLLAGTIVLALPLIFGSLAGVLCERSGVVNIAIEGQLLAGAFASAVVASLTKSAWLGLVVAPLAGVMVSAILALFAIRYKVDQIIVGVVLNVLILGLTGYAYGQTLTTQADRFNQPPTFSPIAIPLLSKIPILGPVLFEQNIMVYLMVLAVAGVHVALFKTRWGLRVRAVGEHPRAADTVGINVNRTRTNAVLWGGAVAGLGGVVFTLTSVGAFSRGMTAGQGFIALAALVFGRWRPVGSLLAALLFGFVHQLQSVLGVLGSPVPSQLMLMAPYVVTIVVVAGVVGRVRAPAADGQPYNP